MIFEVNEFVKQKVLTGWFLSVVVLLILAIFTQDLSGKQEFLAGMFPQEIIKRKITR